MKPAHTVSLDDVTDAVEALSDEQRALVIDFARALLQRDELRLPEGVPFDGPALEAWQARHAQYAARTLEQRRRDLEALDLPADGELAKDEWPADMLETSKTSVAT